MNDRRPSARRSTPTPEQFDRIEALFEGLAPLSPEQRRSRLDAIDDPDVRSEVEAMLAAHDAEAEEDATLSMMRNAQTEATSALRDADPTNEWIGPYRLLDEIGRGGMGVVFRAEQREPMRRDVAVKVIKLGMDTEDVIARFESERQALAMMSHPAIAQVFEAGATSSGHPYFAMEYVPGRDILRYADDHRLTIAERLRLFIRLCEGVQHAHQKGIIHRDLKPSNVLVREEGGEAHPKIIDFGIAKATAHRLVERTLYTQQGQIVGTPEYMSPEQTERSALDIDTRSDIYSLGVLLYELLVGALPFDPETLRSAGYDEILRHVRETPAPRPSTRITAIDDAETRAAARSSDVRSLRRTLSGDLDWIVMKALDKDRNRRYAGAAEFADDIRRHLDALPVLAGPPSNVYRLRKFVRRNRVRVAAAAAVFLALVAGVIATSWQAHLASVAERAAAASAARAEREAATSAAISGFLTDMLTSIRPEAARGREITVREVVDQAASEIDDSFEDQPLVAAQVRRTLGATYYTLGAPEKARPLLEAAIERLESAPAASRSDLFEALTALGLLHLRQGDFARAERLLTRAADVADEIEGPEAERSRIAATHNLGYLSHSRSDYAGAEERYRAAATRARERLGETNRQTIRSTTQWARTLASLGRSREALEQTETALTAARATLEPDDPLLAQATLLRGWIDVLRGRLLDAKPLYLESAERHRRVYGPAHPETLRVEGSLSWLHMQLGELEEALEISRRAYENSVEALGDSSEITTYALISLASALESVERYGEAARLLERQIDVMSEAVGAESLQVAALMNNLAGIYWKREDRRCIDLWRRVVEIRRASLGAGARDTLAARMNVGLALTVFDETEQALLLYESLAEEAEAALGPSGGLTLSVKSNLAFTLRNADRPADAARVYEQVVPTLLEQRGEWSADTLNALLSWGAALRDAGRIEAAIELAERLHQRSRSEEAPEWLEENVGWLLGSCRWRVGEFERAERLMLAWWEGRDLDSAAPSVVVDAAEEMAAMYRAWGRAEEADVWAERAAGYEAAADADQPPS